VSHWLTRSGPQEILNADIFFDAMPVYGEQGLAVDLRTDAIEAASGSTAFLNLMSLNAAKAQTPINWLGRFKLDDDGRMDLKRHGIMPIFSAARVLALRHGLPHHATASRLDALRGRPNIIEDCVDGLIEAHQILLRQILLQQLADIEHGVPLSNRVDPRTLSYSERVRLKWALEQVPLVNNLLGDPVGSPYRLMPIHPDLTRQDAYMIGNNVKLRLCRVYEDLERQADLPAIAAHFAVG
jgi:DNA polymerase-3 subunit epsilon/CBS domain-containing protein